MVNTRQIDINCDLGEGLGNEASIMPYLSSCNVACGGHAGDRQTIDRVVKLAKVHNVRIGAHPSFPDKVNFGRKHMIMSDQELYVTLRSQIMDMMDVAAKNGLSLNHIKPHGALYNMAARDVRIATVVIDVLMAIDPELVLYAPFGSEISRLAHQSTIKVSYEGFADRTYNEDLSLVSRTNPLAIIKERELIFEQVFRMITEKKVKAINGVEVGIKTDTICLHGDHENVVENLVYLSQKLKEHSIKIL